MNSERLSKSVRNCDGTHGSETIAIIVAGYPKSGNTWVTRLVAELIGCPAAGYWPHNTADVAREGDDRDSPYRCFKSHHQFAQLESAGVADRRRIIYVLRDPRDVSVSAAYYFHPDRLERFTRHLSRHRPVTDFYHRTAYAWINPFPYRLQRTIHAVLFGDAAVNPWCRVSWKEHVSSYSSNACFITRYEDMLCQPLCECHRILEHLQIGRSDDDIEHAIAHQSFEARKNDFKHLGDRRRYKFMRKGTSGQWKQVLSSAQVALFQHELAAELKAFRFD